jgi:hypothetical protein
MIRANCLRWDRGPVLALLAAVAAVAPAWADGPPLVVRGELKVTDPSDRVHSEATTSTFEVGSIPRMTTGTDPGGGVMLDAVYNDGSVFDSVPARAGLLSIHHSGPAWRP